MNPLLRWGTTPVVILGLIACVSVAVAVAANPNAPGPDVRVTVDVATLDPVVAEAVAFDAFYRDLLPRLLEERIAVVAGELASDVTLDFGAGGKGAIIVSARGCAAPDAKVKWKRRPIPAVHLELFHKTLDLTRRCVLLRRAQSAAATAVAPAGAAAEPSIPVARQATLEQRPTFGWFTGVAFHAGTDGEHTLASVAVAIGPRLGRWGVDARGVLTMSPSSPKDVSIREWDGWVVPSVSFSPVDPLGIRLGVLAGARDHRFERRDGGGEPEAGNVTTFVAGTTVAVRFHLLSWLALGGELAFTAASKWPVHRRDGVTVWKGGPGRFSGGLAVELEL